MEINRSHIGHEDLIEVKKSLYGSNARGYHIISGFISPKEVQHICEIFSPDVVRETHKQFPGKSGIYNGCPNYYAFSENENFAVYNYMWARPLDQFSRYLSVQIQSMRNALEGRPPYSELFPDGNQAVSYRFVINWNGQEMVQGHTDYYHPEDPLNKNHDPSRLQATLVLSKWGTDYSGEGFWMQDNSGHELVFGRDVRVNPGDLVFWRYWNLHGVRNIQSEKGQQGFIRFIYPPEVIGSKPAIFRDSGRKLGSLIKKCLPNGFKQKVKEMIRR